MSTLLDTNVLTRSTQKGHVQQALARDAIQRLIHQGDEVCIVPQNLYEFWAVATRPAAENGLGMTPAQAKSELAELRQVFTLFRDERGILREWEQLVHMYDVKGKTAHDARLVAAMHRHGITHLLTFNQAHFARFPGITVLTPHAVLQAAT